MSSHEPGFFAKHFGKKCPTCGQRGYSDFIDSVVLGQTQGLETRTRTTKVKNSEGEVVQTVEREVDVPVVYTKTRYNYRCRNCGGNWYQTIRSTREGTLPRMVQHHTASRETFTNKETITKEIVKVPCKFCGTLNVLATDKFCSGCGAPVK